MEQPRLVPSSIKFVKDGIGIIIGSRPGPESLLSELDDDATVFVVMDDRPTKLKIGCQWRMR
jgi:hypothetical protein